MALSEVVKSLPLPITIKSVRTGSCFSFFTAYLENGDEFMNFLSCNFHRNYMLNADMLLYMLAFGRYSKYLLYVRTARGASVLYRCTGVQVYCRTYSRRRTSAGILAK